ncbi:MAG TPA: hypothetical protein VIG74_06535 [Alphaproteobacteria bacterium]|jgi:hypothetical protein
MKNPDEQELSVMEKFEAVARLCSDIPLSIEFKFLPNRSYAARLYGEEMKVMREQMAANDIASNKNLRPVGRSCVSSFEAVANLFDQITQPGEVLRVSTPRISFLMRYDSAQKEFRAYDLKKS